MERLGYYAKDNKNNLFYFTWVDGVFFIRINDELVEKDPEDYEILEVGYFHQEEEEPVYLILGNITFLDEQNDGEHKAIVHRIDKSILCTNEDIACELGDESLHEYEGYLVPSTYSGEIEYLMDDYETQKN